MSKIRWFARGGGVAKCGPFTTQVEATEAIREVEENDMEYKLALLCGEDRNQFKGGFPDNAFVWPEVVK